MLNYSVRFTPANITALKKALQAGYPQVRSSHLDEAIASSFGFKSYAAMRPILHEVSTYARLVVNTDHFLLLIRLEELGYRDISLMQLRHLVWMVNYPHALHDEKNDKVVRERYRPIAANT